MNLKWKNYTLLRSFREKSRKNMIYKDVMFIKLKLSKKNRKIYFLIYLNIIISSHLPVL